MILNILAIITVSYILYYKNYFQSISEKRYNISDKFQLFKNREMYKKQQVKKNINKLLNYKINLIEWKNNIENVNNEFYKKIFIKKNKDNLDKINNKDHLCFWALDNNIQFIKNYNVVAFNFKTIYDYENNKILETEYLYNLSKYCHINKIIFVIISEISPQEFNEYKPKFFNKNNYYSPYNYKNKMFGSVQKLKINKTSNKPANITINRIILDIMNRYGCDKNNILYIDNEKLNDINTFIL